MIVITDTQVSVCVCTCPEGATCVPLPCTHLYLSSFSFLATSRVANNVRSLSMRCCFSAFSRALTSCFRRDKYLQSNHERVYHLAHMHTHAKTYILIHRLKHEITHTQPQTQTQTQTHTHAHIHTQAIIDGHYRIITLQVQNVEVSMYGSGQHHQHDK